MKQDTFEELLCMYGTDISVWPTEVREAAQIYAETEVGIALLEAEHEIDQMFEAGIAMGPETASDGNSDAFLSRLACIPEQHAQAVYAVSSGNVGLFTHIKTLFAETFRFSAASYAAQGFAFVAVLTAGIMVGAQTTVATADDDLDLSEDWFASASDVEELE
ncbi:hypothetical protein KFE96_02190 [Kordiimonas sp. SCSIO 12603]|uniref:hypothetical protein n=1 Tax=Kordiimonas sp. SCSIO 12603 TaxID=2829596 RepID=UPI0021067D03|nr:hypothetical protein [Kordiimonas sp. SCSIO 12603]UTW59139.1 hypothetical protein KFE96_02190 [Kordiimonas sp. SCSIO 12603]